MIRDCTEADLPWVYEKAVEFNTAYWDVPLDTERAEQTLTVLLQTGVVIRSEAGVIAGIVMPDMLRLKTYLVEIGWFDTGKNGLKLLSAFEQRARELGVDEIRMTTLHQNQKVGAFLERRGYRPLEHAWGLRLGD